MLFWPRIIVYSWLETEEFLEERRGARGHGPGWGLDTGRNLLQRQQAARMLILGTGMLLLGAGLVMMALAVENIGLFFVGTAVAGGVKEKRQNGLNDFVVPEANESTIARCHPQRLRNATSLNSMPARARGVPSALDPPDIIHSHYNSAPPNMSA